MIQLELNLGAAVPRYRFDRPVVPLRPGIPARQRLILLSHDAASPTGDAATVPHRRHARNVATGIPAPRR
jgi:hypothetical protein